MLVVVVFNETPSHAFGGIYFVCNWVLVCNSQEGHNLIKNVISVENVMTTFVHSFIRFVIFLLIFHVKIFALKLAFVERFHFFLLLRKTIAFVMQRTRERMKDINFKEQWGEGVWGILLFRNKVAHTPLYNFLGFKNLLPQKQYFEISETYSLQLFIAITINSQHTFRQIYLIFLLFAENLKLFQ